MKRIVSVILCVLLLCPILSVFASFQSLAEQVIEPSGTEGYENITLTGTDIVLGNANSCSFDGLNVTGTRTGWAFLYFSVSLPEEVYVSDIEITLTNTSAAAIDFDRNESGIYLSDDTLLTSTNAFTASNKTNIASNATTTVTLKLAEACADKKIKKFSFNFDTPKRVTSAITLTVASVKYTYKKIPEEQDIYKSIFDFEDQSTAGINANNANATAINSDAANVASGSYSYQVKYTTATANRWPFVTFTSKEGSFAGEGLRVWHKASTVDGWSFSRPISLILANGTEIQRSAPSKTTDGNYVIFDYASMGLTEEQIATIVAVRFNFKVNANASEIAMYFDDIQVINPVEKVTSLEITKVRAESVSLKWEIPEHYYVDVYQSDTLLDDSTFDSAPKTLIASETGLLECTATGLTENKMYYWAVKATYANVSTYAYISCMPTGFVWDFDSSTLLNDYSSKVNNNWYYVNAAGAYGVSTYINTDSNYSNEGNSFALKFGTRSDTGTRWPNFDLYAPNYAAFSGEGFRLTVAKTKDENDKPVTVTARVELFLEDGSSYTKTGSYTDVLFSESVEKHTVDFTYSDFYLTSDKNVKLTAEQSQYIKYIRFSLRAGGTNQFTLFFDSVQVINPIVIKREAELIEFQSAEQKVQVGTTSSQVAVITPFNATENDLIWTSSDENVVSIDSKTGKYTAIGKGIAEITATAPNGVSGCYTLVVADDERMFNFRTLFDFDDGFIPEGLTMNGYTATLSAIKSDAMNSLKLTGKGSVTFTANDYDFYGEGFGVWLCGTDDGSAVIKLHTTDNKDFSKKVNVNKKYGFSELLDYSEFRNSSNKKPSVDDIINIKSVEIISDGIIYVDSIRIKNPDVYTYKTIPENDTGDTNIVITDDNSALGDLRYQIDLLESGVEYDMVVAGLMENKIISDEEKMLAFSMYFIDENYVEHDLSAPITVNYPTPDNLLGLNNIWVLHFDNEGNIVGIKADVNFEEITFSTLNSGIYCLVGRTDTESLKYKVKTVTENKTEVIQDKTEVSMPLYENEQEETTTVKKVLRRKKKVAVADNVDFNWYWIIGIIVLAVLVISAATVFTIVFVKKRKKERKQ